MTTTTYTEQGKELLERLKKIAEDSKGDDIEKIRAALNDLQKLQKEVNDIITQFKKNYTVKNENVPPIMEMNKWAKPKNFKGLQKILSAAQLETVQKSLDVDNNGKFEADEQKFALELYNSVDGDIGLFMEKVKKFRAVTKAVREKLGTSRFVTSILQKAGVKTAGRAKFTNITDAEKRFIETVVTKKFLLDTTNIGANISTDFGSWLRSQNNKKFPKFRAPNQKIKVKQNFPQSRNEFMKRKLNEFENQSVFTMYSQNRKTGDPYKQMSGSSSLSNVSGSLPPETKKKLNEDLNGFYTPNRNRKNKTLKAFLTFLEERRGAPEEVEEETIPKINGRRPPPVPSRRSRKVGKKMMSRKNPS